MDDSAVIEALKRIEMEFAALPGLKLTLPQVNRLCNMPNDICETALTALTRSGFLQVRDDMFLRAARRYPNRAVIA